MRRFLIVIAASAILLVLGHAAAVSQSRPLLKEGPLYFQTTVGDTAVYVAGGKGVTETVTKVEDVDGAKIVSVDRRVAANVITPDYLRAKVSAVEAPITAGRTLSWTKATPFAGPTLAYWLRKSGHAVTLVESAPQLRSGGWAATTSSGATKQRERHSRRRRGTGRRVSSKRINEMLRRSRSTGKLNNQQQPAISR